MNNQINFDKMDAWIENTNTFELIDIAETITVWDFNTALGSTLIEKYESLHVCINTLSSVLIRKGASGYFWVLCSSEISSMLDKHLNYFNEYEGVTYLPMGAQDKTCVGILDRRFKVYIDSQMPIEHVIIGCGHDPKPEHIGRIRISNFII